MFVQSGCRLGQGGRPVSKSKSAMMACMRVGPRALAAQHHPAALEAGKVRRARRARRRATHGQRRRVRARDDSRQLPRQLGLDVGHGGWTGAGTACLFRWDRASKASWSASDGEVCYWGGLALATPLPHRAMQCSTTMTPFVPGNQYLFTLPARRHALRCQASRVVSANGPHCPRLARPQTRRLLLLAAASSKYPRCHSDLACFRTTLPRRPLRPPCHDVARCHCGIFFTVSGAPPRRTLCAPWRLSGFDVTTSGVGCRPLASPTRTGPESSARAARTTGLQVLRG